MFLFFRPRFHQSGVLSLMYFIAKVFHDEHNCQKNLPLINLFVHSWQYLIGKSRLNDLVGPGHELLYLFNNKNEYFQARQPKTILKGLIFRVN